MVEWLLNFFVYLGIVMLCFVFFPLGLIAFLLFHFMARRWPFS